MSKPNNSPELQGAPEVKERQRVKRPRLYRVLLHNDDYTTMEFVVRVLMEVFHKGQDEATAIMLHVHTRGVGVCGVYAREIAESKVAAVMAMAREEEHPLLCTMEPEDDPEEEIG